MVQPCKPSDSRLQVVHEGRGGHLDIDGRRYAIEHVGEGRFAIHFPGGQRHARLREHRQLLQALVQAEPSRWQLEATRTGSSRD